jgi:3-hydroxybutyrate dehydrogenase
MAVEIQEPEITTDDILFPPDKDFNSRNVCIITAVADPIGRAIALATAANKLMTVGLDIDQEGGERTQYLAREMGGQMIFLKTDLSRIEDIDYAVAEASKLGSIKYLVNVGRVMHIGSIEQMAVEHYDFVQRTVLRAPLYMCKLVIPHMKKSSDGRGIIGNMASPTRDRISWRNPMFNIVSSALHAMSESISSEGQGMIRFFFLGTDSGKHVRMQGQVLSSTDQRSMKQKDDAPQTSGQRDSMELMISPVEVANLFIFGFSRFGKHLRGEI